MGEWIARTREGIKFVQVFEVSTFLHLIGQNKVCGTVHPRHEVYFFAILCDESRRCTVTCANAAIRNSIAPSSSTIRHISLLLHLTETEKLSFANILSMITKLYDNLFSCSFASSTGIHQRPIPPEDEYIDSGDEAKIAHFHVPGPPLLRRATYIEEADSLSRPFGLLAGAQRDTTPKQAASRLRACHGPEVHYSDR
ncbi:hypothetical protein BGY98DRAFT_931563 [Russula aff. rugulosa BPL654]|nr:hypothetical protein BGY98DRAFT_931563 [Russula aff. rugulosa BPL654]